MIRVSYREVISRYDNDTALSVIVSEMNFKIYAFVQKDCYHFPFYFFCFNKQTLFHAKLLIYPVLKQCRTRSADF